MVLNSVFFTVIALSLFLLHCGVQWQVCAILEYRHLLFKGGEVYVSEKHFNLVKYIKA